MLHKRKKVWMIVKLFLVRVDHRCRSRQIFGGAKEVCPHFTRSARKKFGTLFMQFSCDFGCHFFKSKHIGCHFYQIKANWAPFLLVFLWSVPRYSEIFEGFHKFCPDFHWFCPDFKGFCRIFTKSKPLGVRLHLLHPRLLHHCRLAMVSFTACFVLFTNYSFSPT